MSLVQQLRIIYGKKFPNTKFLRYWFYYFKANCFILLANVITNADMIGGIPAPMNAPK